MSLNDNGYANRTRWRINTRKWKFKKMSGTEVDIKEGELNVKERELSLHEDNNERNFQLLLDIQGKHKT